MGRFINCFTVVILKFKMTTTFGSNLVNISPAGRDSNMISKCVCSVYCAIYISVPVEVVLFFVAASRNADMTLHLAAGERLSKLFFSMD